MRRKITRFSRRLKKELRKAGIQWQERLKEINDDITRGNQLDRIFNKDYTSFKTYLESTDI